MQNKQKGWKGAGRVSCWKEEGGEETEGKLTFTWLLVCNPRGRGGGRGVAWGEVRLR